MPSSATLPGALDRLRTPAAIVRPAVDWAMATVTSAGPECAASPFRAVRTGAALVLVGGFLAVCLPARGAEPPVFATGVDVVAVDVSVVDAEGRPVLGLGPADFTLKVGGRQRRLVSVQFVTEGSDAEEAGGTEAPPEAPSAEYSTNEHARPGRLVLIVVDQGNIPMGGGRGTIAAADKLLAGLTPADRVGLLTVPTSGPRVEFTTDHAAVREAMRNLVGRGRLAGRHVSLTEALAITHGDDPDKAREAILRECGGEVASSRGDPCAEQLATEARAVVLDFRERSTTALNVLRSLFDTLKAIDAPKTVVLITQGLGDPESGPRSGFGFVSDIRPLGEAAAAARVSLFAVRVEPGGQVDAETTMNQATMFDDQVLHEHGLETLVSVARGEVLRGLPERAFERIAREISGHYLLGFEAEGPERDGKAHGIKVSVSRPRATVRAWSAVTIARPSSPKQEEQALVASLRSPQPATALPIRVATYALPDPASRKVRVLVSAELGAEGTAGAMSVAYVLVDGKDRVLASAAQRAKGAGPVAGRVPFVASVLVEPGQYTLKLAARDMRGRTGRVDHPVRAMLTSAPGGEVETGDLVIGPLPAPGAGFRAAAGPDIPGSEVVVRWDVCAPESRPLDVGDAVVDIAPGDGGPAVRSVVARVAPTDVPNHRVVQAVLPVSDLAPGRYAVRVSLALPGRHSMRASHTLRLSAPPHAAGS